MKSNLVALLAAAEGALAASVPMGKETAPRLESRSAECCAALAAVSSLSSSVVLPGSEGYESSVSSYWAAQQQLISPSCILSAKSATDVSVALKVLVPKACKFAVRSGGHGSAPGVSNIQDGITIDLRAIDQLDPSADSSSVVIGPGQTWGSVYTALAELGVSVAGVRAGTVGVAGSTLGGGVGYFMSGSGFTADNVIQYEVVLADGSIVTASSTTNSDLFKALKGGGSNLGVVTKFVYKTFPLGNVWGGDTLYSLDKIDQHVEAYSNFVANPDPGNKAQTLMSFFFAPSFGAMISNSHFYAGPEDSPAAFSEFLGIEDALISDVAVTTLPAIATAAGQRSPAGLQQITFSTAFNNDAAMIKEIFEIWNASWPSIATVSGLSWALTLASVRQTVKVQSDMNGGNILGIDIPDEGLVLTMLSATYSSPDDFADMTVAANGLLCNIINATKARGLHNPWIDLNHASSTQKVMKSYGNAAALNQAAKKYDPKKVFQNLLVSPFRL